MEDSDHETGSSEATEYLEKLQLELIRPRPSQVYSISNEALGQIFPDAFERDAAIASMTMEAGCDIEWNQIIATDPEVRGVVFTRRADLPAFDAMDPEGEA